MYRESRDLPRVPLVSPGKTIRVALAGNPNTGKTTLFNALTGARQRVGNYPGITVERREGRCRHHDQLLSIIDLPGTYGLSAYSPEERVAQDELIDGDYDLVVLVANSLNLQRSLILLAQVLQTKRRVVLALNMADEARAAGQKLDLKALGAKLGFPVVETEGHRARGVEELKDAILECAQMDPPTACAVLGEEIGLATEELALEFTPELAESPAANWLATRLLADDIAVRERLAQDNPQEFEALVATTIAKRERLERSLGEEINVALMQGYNSYVADLLSAAVIEPAKLNDRSLSDRLDTIMASRIWGLPFFGLVMFGLFWFTFTLGEPPMGWIESGMQQLGAFISSFWEPGSASPLRSLLVDGIIGGVGGVLVFLPNIVLLFFGLALLEDSGYMARAAFLMDRVMSRFGLHGKSFVPMLTGFGCNIPGIMATRTLENEKDRLTTIFVLPFMSCGARLTIWLLLIPAFIPFAWQALALWGIYIFGGLLAFVSAFILRRSILKGEPTPFVMELPPYRLPTLKSAALRMFDRAWTYTRKAGTVILAISIVLWFLTHFPQTESYAIDQAIADGEVSLVGEGSEPLASEGAPVSIDQASYEAIKANEQLENSAAGAIGHAMEPGLTPLGFDWRMGTAMVGAFAAKEVFIAQMGIVFSLNDPEGEPDSLRERIRSEYPPATGLSLIVFLLIATPCMATVAVTKRETGRWSWAIGQFMAFTVLGYLLAMLTYQVASLFG